MTDLVLLTAGPDSVFALDYALKQTDEPLLAVFVYTGSALSRIEKRHLETKIVPYMRRTRRHFDFFVQALTFPNGYSPHHNIVTGICTATMVMAYGNIGRVYRGDSAEECILVREGKDGHGVSGELVFNYVVPALLAAPGIEIWGKGSNPPEPCLPGKYLSKIKYTAEFEPALKSMLISCVNPQRSRSGAFTPCGVCQKCKMMEGILHGTMDEI